MRFLGLIIGGIAGLFATIFVLEKIEQLGNYINITNYVGVNDDTLYSALIAISVLFLGFNLISLIINIKKSISP